MRVCGVDIKGNEARLALVDKTEQIIKLINSETKKISLCYDKETPSLNMFSKTINTFYHENKIDFFAIKSRTSRGRMASGGVTFKIETLFQLVDGATCKFFNAVAIANFDKKNLIELPEGLHGYQHDAFRCAMHALAKG